MESLGAEELQEIGAREITASYRGLYFQADAETLYRINYTSRLLTRVLAPLHKFRCMNKEQLYQEVRQINWNDFISASDTFAVFANVSHSKMNHSHYAALVVKDAVVDQFREKYGRRPSVRADQPTLWINLHIEQNLATVSIDVSGGSLHKRGYRLAGVDAPMQETLAAAIIRLSEWRGDTPLYDPMCGSGTLICEALMQARKLPAGMLRKQFGFMRLPDFSQQTWTTLKSRIDSEIMMDRPLTIAASDMSPRAVEAIRKNLSRLPGSEVVHIKQCDFRRLPGIEKQTIITNPPYGIRSGKRNKMSDFYKAFGDFLKQRCQGSTAYIYFGERQWLKSIGLRPSWKYPLVNGALDGRLAKFELY